MVVCSIKGTVVVVCSLPGVAVSVSVPGVAVSVSVVGLVLVVRSMVGVVVVVSSALVVVGSVPVVRFVPQAVTKSTKARTGTSNSRGVSLNVLPPLRADLGQKHLNSTKLIKTRHRGEVYATTPDLGLNRGFREDTTVFGQDTTAWAPLPAGLYHHVRTNTEPNKTV